MKVSSIFVQIFMILSAVCVYSKTMVCVEIGACIKCSRNELTADYCKETGRKIKMSCHQTQQDEETSVDDFHSCALTAEDDQLRLVVFQVLMAVVGGLAYWGVQVRKQNTMSLFDNRKQRLGSFFIT